MPADSTEVTDSSPTASGLRYGEALAELEELLDDLEEADIDVDRLAERVARGVELVRFCRDRLAVVTTDVDQVVADLLVIDVDDQSANAASVNEASANEGSVDQVGDGAGDAGHDDANGGAGE